VVGVVKSAMSRRYFEASTGFNFVVEDEYPKLNNQQWVDSAVHWRKVSNGKNMFPGGIWCAHDFKEGNVGVNRSDYAVYKWARDNHLELPGTYTMGTGIMVFDEDREAFGFAVRSDNVGFDKGKISLSCGGVVDWDNTQQSVEEVTGDMFMGMVNEQAEKELGEELRADIMGKPVLMGTYVDEKTLKMEFGYVAVARRVTLSGDDENVKLLWVKPDELVEFVERNRDRLEASTQGHLEYWIDKVGMVMMMVDRLRQL
jgi:hypothetical protein